MWRLNGDGKGEEEACLCGVVRFGLVFRTGKERSADGLATAAERMNQNPEEDFFAVLPVVLNRRETQNAQPCPRYEALLYERLSEM